VPRPEGDNCDATEAPFTDATPNDCYGLMGITQVRMTSTRWMRMPQGFGATSWLSFIPGTRDSQTLLPPLSRCRRWKAWIRWWTYSASTFSIITCYAAAPHPTASLRDY